MDILDELKMLADHIDDENNGKPDALSLLLIRTIGEIRKLRADLAKVTWQRNEAQAGLAASRAELAHYVNRFGLWGAPLPRASLSTIHTLADQPGLDGESPA